MRRVPWSTWLVGWAAAIVLAGGLATVLAHEEPEVVERTVRVLPEGQARVTGRLDRLAGTDVVGGPLHQDIRLETGTATIELPGETIVWDGGRPFVLEGRGLDPGPSSVVVEGGVATWSIDGPRVLLPGDYVLRTPVAVGAAGLARPVDEHRFRVEGDAFLDAPGATISAPVTALALRGPGELVLDGHFEVETRDGRRRATHLEFGPGPLVVDVSADGTVAALLNGPLR